MSKNYIQMTLIQFDNYGPWTLSLGSNREPYLQVLQSELYSELQRLFTVKGGLVFQGRFDNMLALTNGISIKEHAEIQERLCKLFPITVSMGIGTGKSPVEAQYNATKAIQNRGSSKHEQRKKILEVQSTLHTGKDGFIEIAHVDVNDITRLTDSVSAYDILTAISKIYNLLIEEFLKIGSLVFFIGGDNFLIVSNGIAEDTYKKALRRVSKKIGLDMKAGIGIGRSATEALKLATEALDKIRHNLTEKKRSTESVPVLLIESKI